MAGTVQAGTELAFGVAGWSYPDWRDTVYRLPPSVKQPSLFDGEVLPAAAPAKESHAADPLAYLARFVDMIEVNSSFYLIPTPASVQSWVHRTAAKPGFFFTAKLFQDFTHRFRRDPDLARQFRAAFTPLREAGMLRGLLAQFRYDFRDDDESRRLLLWIRDAFADFAHLIVEVRHGYWEGDSAREFLRSLGVSVAVLDYPMARDSFRARANLGAAEGYFRLHGRNAEGWFASVKEPHEPYNYDYSDSEIGELAETARSLLPQVRSLTIVANNHYQGKGLSAALRLKSELLRQKVPVPPALLETYPALRRIAAAAPEPGS
ncbi:MAG: DUF72 domain-containing protein [Lentisphaeria bacterium]|nr:DUF72 domain-containing protein [Lentisphaeria bacterium]